MCLSKGKGIQSAFIILLIHPVHRPQQPRGPSLLCDAVRTTHPAGAATAEEGRLSSASHIINRAVSCMLLSQCH